MAPRPSARPVCAQYIGNDKLVQRTQAKEGQWVDVTEGAGIYQLTSLLAKCQVPESDKAITGRSAMMDKRGEGVQIILEQSERLSGKRPLYRLVDDSELLLVIPAAALPEAAE